MTDVTVVGLGQMGMAIADLLMKAGKSVTVWNRSQDKASELAARGAFLARSPSEAFSASGVIIICVYDYAAANQILAADGVTAALDGRLVINLGTGGADEARAAETHINEHGGRYLDGAIQAAPSQMGQADTPILLSGNRIAFDDAKNTLAVLAGNIVYLGEAIDAAAFMDLATLSYVYGAFAGFLHGARMAETVGISVETFGGIVSDISPTFGVFFKHEGAVIVSDDFTISESPMRISIAAVERILRTSERLAINAELPALVNRWLQEAEKSGLADEEVAALIKVLRKQQF